MSLPMVGESIWCGKRYLLEKANCLSLRRYNLIGLLWSRPLGRGQDAWMASQTHWTWVWASFRSWWWTRKPGVLQLMGSQSRTLLSNWTELRLQNCLFGVRVGYIKDCQLTLCKAILHGNIYIKMPIY